MGHQRGDYVKKKWKWETRTSIIGVCCLQRAVVDTIHRCHNLERECTINCDSILWLQNKSREGRAQFYLLTAFTWYRVYKDLSFKCEEWMYHIKCSLYQIYDECLSTAVSSVLSSSCVFMNIQSCITLFTNQMYFLTFIDNNKWITKSFEKNIFYAVKYKTC